MNPDSITYLTGAGMMVDLAAWILIGLGMLATSLSIGVLLAVARKRRIERNAAAELQMNWFAQIKPTDPAFSVPVLSSKSSGEIAVTLHYAGRGTPSIMCTDCEVECIGGKCRCLCHHPQMSDEDRRLQRISFAYGNVSMHNPEITREMVEAESDKIYGAPAAPACGVAQSCNACTDCPDLERK